MSDVVVTVPMGIWEDWIEEGDLPGDPPANSPLQDGEHWGFGTGGGRPDIKIGERVYIVAHGKLRGFSILTKLIVRGGYVEFGRRWDAVAVTIDEPIRGFRGWRYRWWDRKDERPFLEWRTP